MDRRASASHPGGHLSTELIAAGSGRHAQLRAEHSPRGAYVIGDSCGAIAALYATNQRPELVRSLTVSMQPAFSILQQPACWSMMTSPRLATRSIWTTETAGAWMRDGKVVEHWAMTQDNLAFMQQPA
jgi:hypothetical protein